MVETTHKNIPSHTKHTPVGGVATTPLAPLRVDSDPPSSAKMVSLADLHVHSSGHKGSRDGDLHGVDPLDPLLQTLVQDKLFIAAVQTSQLHAAAAAAVKLCKTYFAQTSQDHKRPGMAARNGLTTTRFTSPTAQLQHGAHPSYGPAVRSMKQEVLQLEDSIPWTHVHRTWRNKRAAWRRHVKQTELVTEFALRLKELRGALLDDDSTSFIGCGPTWRAQLESCAQGRGTAALLISVWDEMKNTVRSWLQGIPVPGTTNNNNNNTTTLPHANNNNNNNTNTNAILHTLVPPQLNGDVAATSGRAVQALQAAVKDGSADVLLQTPLESIVGNDTQNLHAVRQVIELERRIVIARLAAMQNGTNGAHTTTTNTTSNGIGNGGVLIGNGQQGVMTSYFTNINADWEHSDDMIHSDGDTEMDQGSDVTDLDEAFD